jgi:hypothetical protein
MNKLLPKKYISIPAKDKNLFFYEKSSTALRPPFLLFGGDRQFVPQGQSDRTVNLTTHFYLVSIYRNDLDKDKFTCITK